MNRRLHDMANDLLQLCECGKKHVASKFNLRCDINDMIANFPVVLNIVTATIIEYSSVCINKKRIEYSNSRYFEEAVTPTPSNYRASAVTY